MSWTDGRTLASVDSSSCNVEYLYNEDGFRIKKDFATGDSHYYHYSDGKLVSETWGTKRLEFLYDDSGIYGVYYSNGSAGKVFYFIKNLQGDVVEIVDQNMTRFATYTYDAWGNVISVKSASGTEITSGAHIGYVNPIRYRGYYYDTETGFYYLQSRYYDPAVGRFINTDGFVSTGQEFVGYNMFAYCGNNSIYNIDPTGTCYYNVSGKWCHDSWEYLGGYVRQPDPKAVDWTEKIDNMINECTEKLDFADICNYSCTSVGEFIVNVLPGSSWDLKEQDDWRFESGKTYRYKNIILREDDPGNILYGYLGRRYFSLDTLLFAAGIVQRFTNTSDESYANSNYDDPRDQYMIRVGYIMWDREKESR